MPASKLNLVIEELKAAASSEDPRSAVKASMESYFSHPETLKAEFPVFADNEVILHEDETVSIWFCRFIPGQKVPPHNHKMPVYIGVYEGAECNTLYITDTTGGLNQSAEVTVKAGEVFGMGPSSIHAVECASAQPSLAIHVYLGALTKVERSLFDIAGKQTLPFTDQNYEKLTKSTF